MEARRRSDWRETDVVARLLRLRLRRRESADGGDEIGEAAATMRDEETRMAYRTEKESPAGAPGDEAAPHDAAAFDLKARAELALCDALEDAADRLPDICAGRYLRLAATLRQVGSAEDVRRLRHRLELLEATEEARGALRAALRLMAEEERRDGDLAVELADGLEEAATQGRSANAEALGYLLRSYFEARRRHLAWRRQAVVGPALRLLGETMGRRFLLPLETLTADIRVITLASAESVPN